MSTPVWCELACGNCSKTSDGRWTYGAPPRRELVKNAKRCGWVFSKDEAFCSRACKDMWEADSTPEQMERTG